MVLSIINYYFEVISRRRSDIELKPEEKPPHYCNYRIDLTRPLKEPPSKEAAPKNDWKELKKEYERQKGKALRPVKRRKDSKGPPSYCKCAHCGAPSEYLYLNDGRKCNQVRCKICNKLSPTHRVRLESKAKYYCPYCGNAMYLWKRQDCQTIFKCPNKKCPEYLSNINRLTPEEKKRMMPENLVRLSCIINIGNIFLIRMT